MKHKQLITFLKNKGFFLAKKEVRKTENGKRITDKKKSCYIISLSPFINDYTEIFRLFSDGRLQISNTVSDIIEKYIGVNNITLTDVGRSSKGLTSFNAEKTKQSSDIFNSIKENENIILCEIINKITTEIDMRKRWEDINFNIRG